MARGLFKLAEPEYRALADTLSATGGLDVVLYRLAECQRQCGARDEAAATCARLAREFPSSPFRRRADMTRGLLLLDAGKPLEAAEALEDVATSPQADEELRITALYHAADARERAGDARAALVRHRRLGEEVAEKGTTPATAELAAYSALKAASLEAKDPATLRKALDGFAAIAAKPFSPRVGAEALYLAAAAAYNAGMHDEAIGLYEKLLATYPSDVRCGEAPLPLAWAYERAGRYADAVRRLDSLDASRGGAPSPESLYLRAVSLAELGRYSDAVAAYDELLAPGPVADDAKRFADAARFERVSALFRQGDYKRVLEEGAALKSAPPEIAPRLLWMQAEAAECLKDESRAAQFYRLIAERHPESPLAAGATYRFAMALQKRKAWAEAARTYQRLVADHPGDGLAARSLFSSGICLAMAGKPGEAIRDWSMLLDKFPRDELVPETLFQKATEEIRGGDAGRGAETLGKLLRDHPSTPRKAEALFWRARIAYDKKDLASAEKDLLECLDATPPEEIGREAAFLLGLVLQAEGRDAEAAGRFQPLLAAPIRAKFSEDRLAWLSEFQFGRGEFRAARDAADELASRKASAEWTQAGNALSGRASAAMAETNAAVAAFRAAADSPAKTRYGAEAALRLGELLCATGGGTAEADRYLSLAARRASSPALAAIRANAYYGLAKSAERQSRADDAVRYYMSVAILFDDPVLVPKALDRAAALLREAGRDDEAGAALEERSRRYPAGKQAR